MQEIGGGLRKNAKSSEIVLELEQQPVLLELAKLVTNIDTTKSIFEGLLDAILTYFDIVG